MSAYDRDVRLILAKFRLNLDRFHGAANYRESVPAALQSSRH